MTPEPVNPPDINKWWTNKRRLAWTAMYALIGIGTGALVNEIGQPQSDLLQAVVYMLGAIVGTYIGFSAWDDIKSRDKL